MAAIQSAYSVEGSGPPLFLIHGIGASRHSWDGLVQHLRGEFRCISYDLRGHGKRYPGRNIGLDETCYDVD